MHRLLAVSDLYLDPVETGDDAQARLPALPALSELLHLGKASPPQRDWRAGLAADLGSPALAQPAPALLAAAAADGIAPGSPVCMAEPVHLVAGMASVHLHPSGLLHLDADSRSELQTQFTREFGARDQALFAVGDGLLLAAPEAAGAHGYDPARMLGSQVEASRLLDPQQQSLRRLGVEVEMWLPGLALNRERERRGELAITALWLWGGGKGSLPEVAADKPSWEWAYGGDPWVHGIWSRLVHGKVQAARGWDHAEPSALMVVSAARGSLPQLEEDWFAPALRDLRAGRMSSLALRIGGQRWDLGSRPRARWWQPLAWQKPQPWYQVLAT
jgi:hypothetical protein